ncbi:MAG: hypothetical protein WA637_06650, partial [Terriglobales bacterium]
MTFTRIIVALACLMCGTLAAQEAKVTQLLSKDLTFCPIGAVFDPRARHVGERSFRDFFRLPPMKENRSQLVDPTCCV